MQDRGFWWCLPLCLVAALLAAPGSAQETSAEYEQAGLALQRDARHDEAIAAFEKAMHIHRIDDGLFTLKQLSALEGAIRSRLARGEYGETDDLQQYLFYLHRKNFRSSDAAFLSALENFADWQVTAWSMDLDLRQGDELPPIGLMSLHPRLAGAQEMYEFLLDMEGTVHPPDLELRREILHKIATMFYLVRLRLQRLQEEQRISPRLTLNGQGTWTRDYGSPVVGRAYERLAESLEELARGLEERDGPGRSAANAWRVLGDWHRAFGRSSEAGAAYQQARSRSPGDSADTLGDGDPAPAVPGFVVRFAPELWRARN